MRKQPLVYSCNGFAHSGSAAPLRSMTTCTALTSALTKARQPATADAAADRMSP